MSIFSKFFRSEIERSVKNAIEKVVDSKLPALVEDVISEKLAKTPDAHLTREGFGWALSIALRKHWPELDGPTAARWLWDYLDVPYGTTGYTWTYAAAQDLAREYAEQFGESA